MASSPSSRPGGSRGLERLRIESLAFGGEGVARHEGKVRFVFGAYPGEEIEADALAVRRRYDRMRLVRVLSPAPGRRQPLCPHTRECGGCATQTLRYEEQLAAKADQVRDCLERIGGLRVEEDGPPLPAPSIAGYRNKMEFSFDARAWAVDGPPAEPSAGPALGLHVRGRFDAVFDLEGCALPPGDAIRAVRFVRAFARERGLTVWRNSRPDGLLRHLVVRHGGNTGEMLVGIVTTREDPALADLGPRLAEAIPSLVGLVRIHNDRIANIARGEETVLWGRGYLRERLCGLEFEVHAQSFFQTNTWGAEVLVGALRRILGERRGERLLDLYCGAGTLGLVLASSFGEVVGVEQVPQAVEDARRNAVHNGIGHARFVEGSVERWIHTADPSTPGDAAARGDSARTCVLVDPPRAGLHARAVEGVLRLAPPWIAYVSCNPSTLARDAALFAAAGYRAERLRIVDLFPHTAHVESVLLLTRSGS